MPLTRRTPSPDPTAGAPRIRPRAVPPPPSLLLPRASPPPLPGGAAMLPGVRLPPAVTRSLGRGLPAPPGGPSRPCLRGGPAWIPVAGHETANTTGLVTMTVNVSAQVSRGRRQVPPVARHVSRRRISGESRVSSEN